MARVSTIAKVFKKEELYNIVLESIRSAGWNVSILNNVYSSPLKILLTSGGKQEAIFVYIWNISHGGKTRSESEFRIQMKGSRLMTGNTYKTLLLGWYDELKIFAAFNAFKHRVFGRSPSVQVSKEALQRATNQGIAFHTKQTQIGQEVVVTFQPSYIMEYIMDIYPKYHKGINILSSPEIRAIENPLDRKIPEEALNRVSGKRQNIVREINQKVRDAKFQKDIYVLYKGKCAICGLQAKLVEAAHIVPVKSEGTDELVNGVLLCRNHHKAYDSGLLAIDENYKIKLNKEYFKWLVHTSHDNKLKEFIENSRIEEKIILPDDERAYPKKEYLVKNCRLKGV